MNDLIQFSNTHALSFVSATAMQQLKPEADSALQTLLDGSGAGADFLGWVNLPSEITDELLADIEETARTLRSNCQYVVVIGIGGSYLGAKAVIEALSDSFSAYKTANTKVLFAGNNISEDYLYDLIQLVKGTDFGLVNISKSGTTTEPALAFRLLKDLLERQVGRAEAAQRIVAITDAQRGALRNLATQEGYKTYVVPDNVGGRFSVLTPVGLLPIAIAGFDIRQLIAGARELQQAPAEQILQYAITRNALYRSGKKIEIMVNYHPRLHYLAEWWKQLYGESEGKQGKGIFPAAVDNTTDLHSMGQWIQEGERIIFETVLNVEQPTATLTVPTDEADLDGLNYLAGRRVDEVNHMAQLGTTLAHIDGSVPNLQFTLPRLSERYLGQLLYFFEKACGVSGYMLEVNPFDQPGVEAYKRNMFALLGKPGFEEETRTIRQRLEQE